jgi:hypothetical protein
MRLSTVRFDTPAHAAASATVAPRATAANATRDTAHDNRGRPIPTPHLPETSRSPLEAAPGFRII